jgi:Ca-activated chloride channel family protein
VQPPTRNRDDLVAAIDRFELQRHTAIGSGIILSLATLFPDAGIDVEQATRGSLSPRDRARAAPLEQAGKGENVVEKKAFTPVPPASNANTAIILLTDGRRTTGPDPQEAAKMAADRGVRVYTVGFGTAGGGPVDFDGMSIYMRFDEEALKAIAQITQAEYFHAGSLADLKKIYETLNSRVVLERKETEISALFAAAAATLAVAAALLSLLWFHRIG